MKNKLMDVVIKYGQYRDVSYIDKTGKSETKRCLIVPAKVVEPIIK